MFWRIAFCIALVASGNTQAQTLAKAPAPARAVSTGAATREVAHYLSLESALQEALAKRDRSGVSGLLAPDFSIRSSALVDIADADSWMQQEFTGAAKPRVVRELSVRRVAGVNIVSFYLSAAPPGGAKGKTDFVVDVWALDDDKLQTRISTPTRSLPGDSVRPSGRN